MVQAVLLHFPPVLPVQQLLILTPESVAQLYNFRISFSSDLNERDPGRPYMVVGLDEEEHARLLAKRCILVK